MLPSGMLLLLLLAPPLCPPRVLTCIEDGGSRVRECACVLTTPPPTLFYDHGSRRRTHSAAV